MPPVIAANILQTIKKGIAIPAHPLALTAERRLDERRQRALSRYYIAAGSGGLAVGVHTTQFAIRQPKIGLFEPVLRLAAEEMDRADVGRSRRRSCASAGFAERRSKPLPKQLCCAISNIMRGC